jgi:hypothetical protein
MLHGFIAYKVFVRGNTVEVVDRFFPPAGGAPIMYGQLTPAGRTLVCDCGLTSNRD